MMRVVAGALHEMQREAGVAGERTEELLEQFCVHLAQPVAREAHREGEEGAAGEIQGGVDECFVHRHAGLAEPGDAAFVGECLGDGLTQDDADILGGVVQIDVEIADRLEGQIELGMTGEGGEHVIEEADAAIDVGLTSAVEIQCEADLGLRRPAVQGGGAHEGGYGRGRRSLEGGGCRVGVVSRRPPRMQFSRRPGRGTRSCAALALRRPCWHRAAMDTLPPRRALRVLLAGPRGFCAGVDRAIRIVEEALRRYGAPVYVRHEIVHNRYVVEQLERQGAIFVDELAQVPPGAQVVFSAHGVAKSVSEDAVHRRLTTLDATCPLVSKVHREAERHFAAGRHIVMIGHAGHPEVEGTMGQLPPGMMSLIEDEADVAAFTPPPGARLAFITQTTLSVDDTAALVAALRARFPQIEGPRSEDICYATTNRQAAVKAIAPGCDLVLVIGSELLQLAAPARSGGAGGRQTGRVGPAGAGFGLDADGRGSKRSD